jgi:sirohydrochlorin cobaltochelatase
LSSYILLISHGSSDLSTAQEMKRLAQNYQARHPDWKIEYCFLELTEPFFSSIIEKIAPLSKLIQVLPLFLFEGRHFKKDIPLLIQAAQSKFPKIIFQLAQPIGVHQFMIDLLYEKLFSIGFNPTSTGSRILIIGHGTSDLEVNSDFLRLTSLFQKHHSFPTVETCFIGMGKPPIEEYLFHLSNTKPGNLWVAPYLLFHGHFIRKILETMDKFLIKNPKWKIQLTMPLNGHELLLETLDARLGELSIFS